MTTLESYLTDGVLRDRADISAVEGVLRETASTIKRTFKDTHWPYEVVRGAPLKKGDLSHSTTAMMIRAVDLLLDDGTAGPRPVERGFPFDVGDKKQLSQIKQISEKALLKDIKEGDLVCPQSRTYGRDDPLTLSFLAEIWYSAIGPINEFMLQTAKKSLKRDPSHDINNFFDFEEKRGTRRPHNKKVKFEPSTPLSNAFIPLRVARTCRRLKLRNDEDYPDYLLYFESTLHDQLSFFSIPDSRFDPAELAFCLEGMLLASRSSMDATLFKRVLDVLGCTQETSAHWRPTKPFLRNERGIFLFPLSVEAANALIRSCGILDGDRGYDGFTEEVIRLLRRFWEWLRARRISISPKGKQLWGWHSEHVADVTSIQLWDTAQVVEFLLGYRRLLHLHIARTSLRLARFDVRTPLVPKIPWDEQTRGAPEARLKSIVGARQLEKGTISDTYETVTVLGEHFQIYNRIGREFLKGWLSGDRENYSMLLYGPPGTGKTTIAENIADALQFRLITITVSDFLAEGGGAIEARAKMIFEVLEAQTDCVVLFDEIDELLLDRSSERHRDQDTFFKFMTPGMLGYSSSRQIMHFELIRQSEGQGE